MAPTRPASRGDFRIAVVCGLRTEFDAVADLLDHHWDVDADVYGRALGDPNMYTTGRIGDNDVVLLCLANAGTASAASATASLRSSHPGLELARLVGICGGVPRAGTNKEILLGDVIIARHIVQYDLGRKYPDRFETKYDAEESLGRAPKSILNMFATFQTRVHLRALQARTTSVLQKLQDAEPDSPYRYPGAVRDRLFPADYLHEHRLAAPCPTCAKPRGACEASRRQTCDVLQCDNVRLVSRRRLEGRLDPDAAPPPLRVVFGRVGSGNTVLKSGEDRDKLAEEHDLDAFDMEAAGMWDELPCVVIKAVCDYTDSHKSKEWQDYAAGAAASAATAFLQRLPRTDPGQGS